MQAQSNMQPGERSTSDPMFIRVSPLLVFLHPECISLRNHCVNQFPCKNYTEPFCVSIHLKYWKTTFRPQVYLGSPPLFTTQIVMPDKVCTKMSFSILTQMPYIRALMPYMFFYSYRNLANVFNGLLFFNLSSDAVQLACMAYMFFYTTETWHVPMDTILWKKDGHAYMHTFTYGMLHQNAYRPLPTTKTLTDLKNAYLLLVSLPPWKHLPPEKRLPAYHMRCGPRP